MAKAEDKTAAAPAASNDTAAQQAEELKQLRAELAEAKKQLEDASSKAGKKAEKLDPVEIDGQALPRIKSTRCDPEKMLATIHKHWPASREEKPPQRIKLRTYVVRGLGSNYSSLQPVVVENCGDGGDAIAAFWDHYRVTSSKRQATAKQIA